MGIGWGAGGFLLGKMCDGVKKKKYFWIFLWINIGLMHEILMNTNFDIRRLIFLQHIPELQTISSFFLSDHYHFSALSTLPTKVLLSISFSSIDDLHIKVSPTSYFAIDFSKYFIFFLLICIWGFSTLKPWKLLQTYFSLNQSIRIILKKFPWVGLHYLIYFGI